MTDANVGSRTIFKRDKEEVELLKKCRDKALQICSEHLHKRVRVEALDGSHYEGVLAGADSKHVYLYVTVQSQQYRQYPFYNPYYYPYYNPYYYDPYYNTILPLVLFDLLAITLI